MLRSISFAAILAALVAPSEAAEKLPDTMGRKYPPEMPEATTEVYKTAGDAELRLYIFKPADLKEGDKRPAIVFFFGGGWKSGSPEQFRYQCRYLASRGMVAITADYRVSSRQQVKAVECVKDAVSAMRYVRGNAERLGIDPNKIAAGGGSAGGHLAACVGVIEGLDDATGKFADLTYRPSALVLFNPALMFGETPGLPMSSERTGVEPEAISPYHHVKSDRPPTLLMFGTADSMIDSARAYRDAMKNSGNRCELEEYPDLPHGFFNVGRNENKEFFATLEAADKFLGSLGYLKGEPTVDAFFEVR
jgi:acetyl esterase/lipase